MFKAGQRFGEFVLQSRIGGGAFGEVWRAHHHAWENRAVAVKIPTDPAFVRQLQVEGVTVSRLAHPNLVAPLAFDPFADPPYLVMEYVPGENLRALIGRGPRSAADAAAVIRQVLAGLGHAHAAGVVHRDVKPENVLVDKRRAAGPGGLATPRAIRLTDFGLGVGGAVAPGSASILLSTDSPASARWAGTVRYMAPEQLDGEPASPQVDLYACGVMLFELLTGRRPAGRELPSELNPAVPAALDDVYGHAVARREWRYPSAATFLAALDEALPPTPTDVAELSVGPGGSVGGPAPARRRLGKRRRLREILLTTMVVAFAVAVVVLPLMAVNASQAREQERVAAERERVARAAAVAARAASGPNTSLPLPPQLPASSPFSTRTLPAPTRPPLAARGVTGGLFDPEAGANSPGPAAPDRPRAGDGHRRVLASNRTTTDAVEARAIADEVADRYPSTVPPGATLDLVAAHDAASMGRNAGKPTPMPGTYSAAPVVGRSGFIMLCRVYEPWPAGKYLVVYRVLSRQDLAGQSKVCFLDVWRDATTYAGLRPPGEAFEPNVWRAIPVAVDLKARTTIEYRFWPERREFAVDRVYVFGVKD